MGQLKRVRLLLVSLGVLVTSLSLSPVSAASANISHAYRTDKQITNGSIVSLDPKRSSYVVPANSVTADRVLGVTVAQNESLLAVDPKEGDTQVAISGEAVTLVSTLNGDIAVGDQIAISPFNGVGMKAANGAHIIGLAQTAFSAATQGATAQLVTDKTGQERKIYLGYSRLSLAVNNIGANDGSADLNSLQKITQSITGRIIPTPRILLSLMVALIALLALITLIYASIYGSIISIGRNPLAKFAIFRSLAAVLGMAGLITAVAGVIIFFLLR